MTELSRHGRAGDVRGFYGRLGVALPPQATREAPVRCFADPAAHRRDDRSPSCSVSLISGAFNCHGCGAGGGAYDAAIAHGLEPRAAIDLMIDHGLTERRNGPTTGPNHTGTTAERSTATRGSAPLSIFAITEEQLEIWAARLSAHHELLGQLRQRRGWDASILREHAIGWDGTRVTVPVRSRDRIVGLFRYAPSWRRRGPKMVAVRGSVQALFPDPTTIRANAIWLVEGHPDALAAISAGFFAVAIPGVQAWKPDWAHAMAGRDVIICLDCDNEGRAAARRIEGDLDGIARRTRVLDLAPERADGYDLTDALLANADHDARQLQDWLLRR